MVKDCELLPNSYTQIGTKNNTPKRLGKRLNLSAKKNVEKSVEIQVVNIAETKTKKCTFASQKF